MLQQRIHGRRIQSSVENTIQLHVILLSAAAGFAGWHGATIPAESQWIAASISTDREVAHEDFADELRQKKTTPTLAHDVIELTRSRGLDEKTVIRRLGSTIAKYPDWQYPVNDQYHTIEDVDAVVGFRCVRTL